MNLNSKSVRPLEPPPKTSRTYHCSHDYREQEIEARGRTRSFYPNARHLAEIEAPFRSLRQGPVPRSKEENDEFIQSWLQQTQARYSHLPEPSQDEELPEVAEGARSKTDPGRRRKRQRSLSDDTFPVPNTVENAGQRFEKRARHKTRHDKYDYKPHVAQKRAPGWEPRGHDTMGKGTARRKHQKDKLRSTVSRPNAIR